MEYIKKLFVEIKKLIVNFFKPFGINSKLLYVPKPLKKMGYKTGFIRLFITIVALMFSFLLKLTNLAIEYRFILLGIILFMLYQGEKVVERAFNLFQSSEEEKYRLIFDDEVVLRGSNIIGAVSNKVLKYEESTKIYRVMSNESVLNTIRRYLKTLWELKIEYIFNVFEILSIIVMLIIAIITNNAIPKFTFAILIVVFGCLSFLCSAYTSLNRHSYYGKFRKYDDEQDLIINDLLRVPNIVNQDLDMRINKFKESVKKSNLNVRGFYRKVRMSTLIETIVQTLCQYGIIIVYLLNVEWNSISLETITHITATLLVVETALSYISRLVRMLHRHNEDIITIEKEEVDMKLILDTYYSEINKKKTVKKVDDIMINPFAIKYMEESLNDKPFTLELEYQLKINSGEVVILHGASGSGKSTFMKLLTERIKVEKTTDIPAASRFLFYDEKLKMGSLSIYEELFCCGDDPDLLKMQDILENLHLWSEIKSNCFDVWQWMKEKNAERSLSNGQRQRLILAKMLYWLDSDIDVMVLDECTSGVDEEIYEDGIDAQTILEYIVRYSNKDKKRIVIIATHQNVNAFEKKLQNEFSFRNLVFKKSKDKNIITEI